jgi:hypothetical protein
MSDDENIIKRSDEDFWKSVLRKYWYFALIFGLILLGAIIGFLLIIQNYVNTSAIGGQGSWTFDQFSMATGLEWVIFLVLQILLFVVVPVLVIAGILTGIIWYGVFSEELKEEIKTRSDDEEEKRRLSKGSEGGGAFGFFMFIGVCIYVILDGHWTTEFGDLSLGYFVDAWIAVFLWALVIAIIVVVLAILWFINKDAK